MTTHELLKPREAALRLGVSVETIRSWVRTGRLRAVRCGAKYIRQKRSNGIAKVLDLAGRLPVRSLIPALGELQVTGDDVGHDQILDPGSTDPRSVRLPLHQGASEALM